MASILTRLALVRRLNRALAQGHVLIEAPAGYGKTFLLRQLTHHRPQSYLLSLTTADMDLSVLQPRVAPFIRPGQTILLDDAHYLEGGREAIAWLRTQLEQGDTRFVIAGRMLPFEHSWLAAGFPIARWSSRRLRFSFEESRVLLGEDTTDRTRQLQEVEGWPLGVSLLARLPPLSDPLPEVREQLFPYLARRVFGQLPPDVHRFLVVTAVPLRFNDALAATLLPDDDARALREEVQRRNLFIYKEDATGWFRYHHLIREYLLQSAPFDVGPYARRVVAWFQEQGDPEAAIEQALDGGMHGEAARLMEQIRGRILDAEGRPMTFYRWIEALNPSVGVEHPDLRLHLAAHMHYLPGYEGAAQAWTEEVRERAATREDLPTYLHASLQLAHFDLRLARYDEVISHLKELLPRLEGRPDKQRVAFQCLAIAYCATGQFSVARPMFQAAIALYEQANEPLRSLNLQQNMAVMLLMPLGRYAEATEIMQAVLAATEDSNWRLYYLTNWCELCLLKGERSAFLVAVAEMEALEPTLEMTGEREGLWMECYRAIAALLQGNYEAARRVLEGFSPPDDEWQAIAWGSLTIRLRRARGQFDMLVRELTTLLDDHTTPSFELSQLALERDIARGIASEWGRDGELHLHPATRRLVGWRARGELVRLRALLALVCRRAGTPRWRRHARAALYAINRYPGYRHLLSHRDPDLGVHFWTMLLEEGIAAEQAQAMLETIGRWEPVSSLLAHGESAVRTRAAETLARIGREEVMPALVATLDRERNSTAARVLAVALHRLEALPPPPLRVQLMGEFALWRGGERVPEAAWSRPIVRRLFQYFVLHRGEPLPRDRIVEDLWPESDPRRATSTFRTVYSGLRPVLDPYIRPRTTPRYFTVRGNVYTFDQEGRVEVDVVCFENSVRRVLAAAEQNDISRLPDDFLANLQVWAPLLPDLTYEAWMVEPGERMQMLYTEGCLYAANAHLARGDTASAAMWAERALAVAPWLESAYQILMRAHARQGNRALALKIYEEAVTALDRELGIAPSAMTRWLATRLRADDTI